MAYIFKSAFSSQLAAKLRYFFFFKQKTAYEPRLSLVGSEICIRDSFKTVAAR